MFISGLGEEVAETSQTQGLSQELRLPAYAIMQLGPKHGWAEIGPGQWLGW